jgi:hypothetical protein
MVLSQVVDVTKFVWLQQKSGAQVRINRPTFPEMEQLLFFSRIIYASFITPS